MEKESVTGKFKVDSGLQIILSFFLLKLDGLELWIMNSGL
jgi:hypothetical protein